MGLGYFGLQDLDCERDDVDTYCLQDLVPFTYENLKMCTSSDRFVNKTDNFDKADVCIDGVLDAVEILFQY